MSTKRDEHLKELYNAKNEVMARLEAILMHHSTHSVAEVCAEVDTIIDRVRRIKHNIIFIKNTETQ